MRQWVTVNSGTCTSGSGHLLSRIPHETISVPESTLAMRLWSAFTHLWTHQHSRTPRPPNMTSACCPENPRSRIPTRTHRLGSHFRTTSRRFPSCPNFWARSIDVRVSYWTWKCVKSVLWNVSSLHFVTAGFHIVRTWWEGKGMRFRKWRPLLSPLLPHLLSSVSLYTDLNIRLRPQAGPAHAAEPALRTE